LIDELVVADLPEAWESAGFTVDPDGVCRVGAVRIRLIGRDAGFGIRGWGLRDVEVDDVDGVPTRRSEQPPTTPASHANGVTAIDHVVLLSPDLERTKVALKAIGLEPRRERDGELGGAPIRQVFYRPGEVILEVVGAADARSDDPSTLWGITFVASDLDASAAFFGDKTSPIKDAVQAGRRITTVRHRELGMSVRTALISPYRSS
jgi:hypothetical protein